MKTIQLALAGMLLGTSSTVVAQSASDARCIVLATGFANQTKDANQQKIAEDTLYFYLGRVGPEVNSAQFKALLDGQAKTITDATAGTLMGECVSAVKSRVKLLQSVGTQPKPPANPQGR